MPNKLRDAGEPDFRAPRYFQFSFATRPGAGATRADSLRDVDECGLAGLGFARPKSRRRNARPFYRNLDLRGKSIRAVWRCLLAVLRLRSGILWRFWRRLRVRPNASPRSLIHFLRRSVLRPLLLLLHSADDFGAVPNRHVFERTRDVVPVFDASVPVIENSNRAGARDEPG